jgi:DNA polymerase III epsilon subunit-like protein
MYFFFDTETTGLPLNWNAPVSDLNNWPRMIQVGYIIYDLEGNHIETKEYIIRPENFEIPEESSNIHGITTDKALAEGIELSIVLNELHQKITSSTIVVAHNISFDEKILGAEFLRKNLNNVLDLKRKICTMKSSVNYCAIPNQYGKYKWPKLEELHKKLFNKNFDNAHNALADIQATADCFWKLKALKVIQ